MKKAIPIIIILVLVLGVGAWWFLGRGGGGVTLPGGIEKEAGEEDESFTGKLKQAIALGVPMKCSYTQGDFTGTGFVQGRKYYGEVSNQGRKGYVIMKDNCMWSWTEGQDQGVKTCFETDMWEEQEGQQVQVPIEAEYHCAPVVFPESKFDPPANINFLDMDQLPGAYRE